MYTGPLRSLIDELGRLPGIGPKSAQRIAFHILKVPGEDALRLADAIVMVKERTTLCEICFNVAEGGALCAVCSDDRRDPEVVCVVEDPRDIVAVERTGFKGRYHVLGGALSPLDGVGREQLRIQELLDRVGQGAIREAIVCTNPTIEGEATAMQVAKELRPFGVTVSRLASGLPVGGDLEYADELTPRARPRRPPAPGGLRPDARSRSELPDADRHRRSDRAGGCGVAGHPGRARLPGGVHAVSRLGALGRHDVAVGRRRGRGRGRRDGRPLGHRPRAVLGSRLGLAPAVAPSRRGRCHRDRQLVGVADGPRRPARRPRGQRGRSCAASPRGSWPTRTAPPWWPSPCSSPSTTRRA